MPQAISTPITSTRHAALRTTANALLTGPLAPQLASAAPVESPDASLIDVCDGLVRVRNAEDALGSKCLTAEDELLAEPQFEALRTNYWALMAALKSLPAPSTTAGAVAVARVVNTLINRDASGKVICSDDYDWLISTVISCLVETEVAA